MLFAGREAAGCGVDSYRASWVTTVVVAARAPCNVFDPWVRWERGQRSESSSVAVVVVAAAGVRKSGKSGKT